MNRHGDLMLPAPAADVTFTFVSLLSFVDISEGQRRAIGLVCILTKIKDAAARKRSITKDVVRGVSECSSIIKK